MSIRTKLLLLIGIGFGTAAAFVVFAADRWMVGHIQKGEEQLFCERLDSIQSILDRKLDLLEKTGQADVYQQSFQDETLKQLAAKYYPVSEGASYPFIIDAKGRIILHPAEKTENPEIESQDSIGRLPEASDKGTSYYTRNGVDMWCMYHKFKPWNWTLCYTISTEKLYQDVRTFRITFLTVMMIVSLSVLLIMWAVTSFITRPIRELTEAATEMATGNLDQTIETGRRDELGILAKSFQQMSNVIREKIYRLDHEVTERKHAQQELAELNKTLEDRVKRRTRALEESNEQLRNTQSQLVQNEKLASIGQLAAGIAHEINNPMAFVVSNFQSLDKYIAHFIELLEKYSQLTETIDSAELDALRQGVEEIRLLREDANFDFILEDIQDLMDDSKEGMDRIIRIVRNLRDFSRVDQPGDYTDFDLNASIQSTLVVARNELKYSTEVFTEFTDVPTLFCNSGQLNQVFLNILVNAAQAIQSQDRDEMGTIRIKTYAEEEYVVCTIADDGPGIPPEHLGKIFDPFFTTKPAGKGTGLGLNVSYDIVVNKHKGRLLVDSEVGRGTTFTIQLPIHFKPSQEDAAESGQEDPLVCI